MSTPSRRLAPTFFASLAGAASLLVVLAACEHQYYWRGAERHDDSETAKMMTMDPAEARRVFLASMAPAAPGKGAYAGTEGVKAQDAANAKSKGCISCHTTGDSPSMHAGDSVAISCIDCHGGNGEVMSTMAEAGRPGKPGTPIHDEAYLKAMHEAHVQPKNPQGWYGADVADGTAKFGEHAHADPKHMHGSRNPRITYAAFQQESAEFVRFINPGDLRIADLACGACHGDKMNGDHIDRVRHSMMSHGAQLWGAALYNNGAVPNKWTRYGEAYDVFGRPARLQGVALDAKNDGDPQWRNPTQTEITKHGVLPYLEPLPAWNIAQPGNILRIFERGQRLPNPEIGQPNVFVEPGKPDKQLSPRGLGTLLRADPVFLGIQKTRLLDPILPMLGTNDHAGDYRSSGCTACHVVYANDRQKYHNDPAYAATEKYAEFGNQGFSFTADPTIPKDESGHPIKHILTSGVPNSSCVVCHMHPGTSFANSYVGYMWWDNESDGEFMYPSKSRTPTAEEEWFHQRKNPEGASLKGLWSDLYPDDTSHTGEVAGANFLQRVGEPRKGDGSTVNDKLKHNQFADFHGHGWMFRAIFKKDRHGNLLTKDDAKIDPADPNKWDKAVHLKDIHLERGMQCVDCHFIQDSHGDGKLYGEVRAAVEITCIDCHGTADKYATLKTSGPAAPPGGRDIRRTAGGKARFKWELGTLYQYSAMDPDLKWEVVQTLDTVNPLSAWSLANPASSEKSRYAKTVQKQRSSDGKLQWGDLPTVKDDKGKQSVDHSKLAHSENDMECYTCHTSWMTSCAGCHLPMKANKRAPMLHNENMYTRNFTQYNYQVLRDDTYMLGRDSAVKAMTSGRDPLTQGGKIVPIRSSSAVLVGSQNAQREWIYSQQQTVSSEGYSGQAFNPHFPHATGGKNTTKMCNDCHVSADNDNNAWMAQLFLQGTNFTNFLGRFIYVATGAEGFEAVVATEREDPQAVFGSSLHALAYPDEHAAFVNGGRRLHESYEHGADGVFGFGGEILDLQLRGEYVYAARGSSGFYVFDVANIDNKGFSERIVTSPVSPLGQELGFDTSYAVSIASPATVAVDPARGRYSNDPSKPYANVLADPEPHHVNMEQKVHPMYAYIYIGDRDEGLIMTFAATLLDGDPQNNYLSRAKLADGTTAFNPGGRLSGLTQLVCAGHYLYATSKSGLTIIDIDNPTDPKVVATIGSDQLIDPQSVAVQFRYAFVADREGLKVVDITNPAAPSVVPGALVKMDDARRVYIARGYAMVAAGKQGLAIVDAETATSPKLVQFYNANGVINDCRDVKVGFANASAFAYLADGKNGLRIVQLFSPNSVPQFRGFHMPLAPELVANYKTHGPALAISKGLDRDRAADESGHQIAVFGRVGARPLNKPEMDKMYLNNGQLWTVTNTPPTAALPFTFSSPETAPKKKEGAAEESTGTRRRR
ncbi:MAG: hypothetical protein ACKVS8_00245 [Phycisphaerales bacterium]